MSAIDSVSATQLLDQGTALLRLGRLEDAVADYERAIALDPHLAQAHSNRGVALTALGRLGEAAASLDTAIALRPEYAEAFVGRASVARELNQWEIALASFERAIALRKNYAEAYFGRSIIFLLHGDYGAGWRDYEWRWQLPGRAGGSACRQYVQPLWLGGESTAGMTLLVHCEKGLGDTLQFCRYVPLLAQLQIRVILQVQAPLVSLLGSLEGVSVLLSEEDVIPHFDYHCPLLSLPLVFKTTLQTIPASASYLRADSDRVAHWRSRLKDARRPRIGLVWRGDPQNADDRNRSAALEVFLQGLPKGFQYVSLQKDLLDAEKCTMRANGDLWASTDELNFDETAALCECLDVIVSVDTSVAHLSAALGKPTWILLPFSPDCRWLLDRTDSPWYPSVKLYRQERIGEWPCVLARIASDLLNARFASRELLLARISHKPEV